MDPDSHPRVRLANESGSRVPVAPLRRAVAAALRLHGCEDAEVSILLATDEAVRELNRAYRGIDSATDVLSFPAAAMPGAPLGDIAIAIPFARSQAKARGVALGLELAYLAIHGVLHLLGWDDASDEERDAMLVEMNRIAVEAGLPTDDAWGSLFTSDTQHPTPNTRMEDSA